MPASTLDQFTDTSEKNMTVSLCYPCSFLHALDTHCIILSTHTHTHTHTHTRAGHDSYVDNGGCRKGPSTAQLEPVG